MLLFKSSSSASITTCTNSYMDVVSKVLKKSISTMDSTGYFNGLIVMMVFHNRLYLDIWNKSWMHSHKKQKDNLEGTLNWVLFVAELEFSKMLVLRLPQNTSNLNIEWALKSKQLCPLRDQPLGPLISYCSDKNLCF